MGASPYSGIWINWAFQTLPCGLDSNFSGKEESFFSLFLTKKGKGKREIFLSTYSKYISAYQTLFFNTCPEICVHFFVNYISRIWMYEYYMNCANESNKLNFGGKCVNLQLTFLFSEYFLSFKGGLFAFPVIPPNQENVNRSKPNLSLCFDHRGKLLHLSLCKKIFPI